MRRRDFITHVSVAAALPMVAWAQQTMPVVGFLGISSLEKMAGRELLFFKQGLAQTGFIEDRNVRIEYRFANEQYDRLPALAEELIQLQVTVLAAPGSPAALPAKAATTTIPIVFMIGSDPVELGLPGAAKAQARELQDPIGKLGLRLTIVNASNPLELEEAFATLVRQHIEALQIGVDPLFGHHVDQLVALATRNKIPTIYPWREFTAAGGLMNYGSSIPDAYQQVGVYTGQILKGAKPAELPVQRATRLRLVLNLKAAAALGLTVPSTLLAQADEVIE